MSICPVKGCGKTVRKRKKEHHMERNETKHLTLMTEERQKLLWNVLAKVGGWQNMQFGPGFRLLYGFLSFCFSFFFPVNPKSRDLSWNVFLLKSKLVFSGYVVRNGFQNSHRTGKNLKVFTPHFVRLQDIASETSRRHSGQDRAPKSEGKRSKKMSS